MDETSVSAVDEYSVIRFFLIRGFADDDILNELSLANESKAPSKQLFTSGLVNLNVEDNLRSKNFQLLIDDANSFGTFQGFNWLTL